MARVKIVLIDDDEMSNYFMKRKIGESKVPTACRAFSNGEQAVDYLHRMSRRQNGKGFPDVIFVDLQMPVMNGFEFLDYYEREFYEAHPYTQVHIVSASIKIEDRNKARGYKCVENYITKDNILQMLREVLSRGVRTMG